jgi:hypothetical protein
MKKSAKAGITVAVVVLAFVFAPILPWRYPFSPHYDSQPAQFSPSFWLSGCGLVYYRAIAPRPFWSCENATLLPTYPRDIHPPFK